LGLRGTSFNLTTGKKTSTGNNTSNKFFEMAPGNEAITRVESLSEDQTEKSNSELNKRLLEVAWSEDEEKHILRRLDYYLIPLVMVMFFTLNLDR
jgi:hypothetical protein